MFLNIFQAQSGNNFYYEYQKSYNNLRYQIRFCFYELVIVINLYINIIDCLIY